MKPKPAKWYKFDQAKGYRQKRPPEHRFVLLAFNEDNPIGAPAGCVVGYLRNSGGMKDRPYFVVPKVGGFPTHWCDCLGDDFKMPFWSAGQKEMTNALSVKKTAKKTSSKSARLFVLAMRGINPKTTKTRGCLPRDAHKEPGEYA